MNLNELKASLPEYAKDLRLNLDSVLSESGAPGLTLKQIWLTALASSIASRFSPLINVVMSEAKQHATDAEIAGAQAATAIMAMNNIYYRFTHLISEKEYATLPARLRMNVMANPGCDKVDFELCSIAVSAINGCGMCVESHEKTLRKHGLSVQSIQSAVRIAAVVHAVAVTAEQTMQNQNES